MLAAALNAFFCASPIYGSAEDFTSPLNFTPCKGVTPAANGISRWWRGLKRFFIKANVLFCVPKENQKSTSDFRFHVAAELHALQGRNASCEAASRRNEKKAFSAAASFFPFRPLLRGLKGQQRRPPPGADTGGSCWGRGQQDTSAAQGTKWKLGTATRLSAAASIFGARGRVLLQ